MPLQVLNPAEVAQAFLSASSDIKYHFAEVGVDQALQAVLFHNGFTSMRLFRGIDDSRAEVKECLKNEFGLDHATSLQTRKQVAVLLAAWESCREQITVEDRHRCLVCSKAQTLRLCAQLLKESWESSETMKFQAERSAP